MNRNNGKQTKTSYNNQFVSIKFNVLQNMIVVSRCFHRKTTTFLVHPPCQHQPLAEGETEEEFLRLTFII